MMNKTNLIELHKEREKNQPDISFLFSLILHISLFYSSSVNKKQQFIREREREK
jgi:hypothetical protein